MNFLKVLLFLNFFFFFFFCLIYERSIFGQSKNSEKERRQTLQSVADGNLRVS